jgi:hypothetical protein
MQWLFYGFRGVSSSGHYCMDSYDEARLKAWGIGRSDVLLNAWVIAKDYMKVFDRDYGYQVDRIAEEAEPDEGVSLLLRAKLSRALLDWFYRNDANHIRADRHLAYQLFDPSNVDLAPWHKAVLDPLGYSLSGADWGVLEGARRAIVGQDRGTPGRTAAIDAFNALLRRVLVQQRRRRAQKHEEELGAEHHHFRLDDARVEDEVREVCLEWVGVEGVWVRELSAVLTS